MPPFKRTKIVATLGPATDDKEVIRALAEAGADVFRLNFSHGDYADHEAAYRRVRSASEATGRAVGILAAGIDEVDAARCDLQIAALIDAVVRKRGMWTGGRNRVERQISQQAGRGAEALDYFRYEVA